jgi:hypothetical protein
MASRLIFLAVIDARISPRMVSLGREKAVRVKGLGSGERLVIVVWSRSGDTQRVIPLNEGENTLPSPLARGELFEVQKTLGGESATTVEVIS